MDPPARYGLAGFRSQPYEIILEPLLQAFRAFFAFCPLESAFSSAIVGLRRELSHRELPDEKLPAQAIIVSFGVAAALETPETG